MYNATELPVSQTLRFPQAEPRWYAVMTRPRHEKRVAEELARSSLPAFLPLVRELHRWSDRRKVLELPLFPGYVFVRITPTSQNKVSVLRLGGVLHFVGNCGHGTPIPENEIEGIRTILASDVSACQTSYLRVGQRVRVRGGVLNDVEGILVECGRRLVVSVDAIQRSLAVTLEGFEVEPV